MQEVGAREFERTEARRVIFLWKESDFPTEPSDEPGVCGMDTVVAHKVTWVLSLGGRIPIFSLEGHNFKTFH